MAIKDTIIQRRSIREYLPKAVPNEVIIELLDTARYAPTACDRQEYYFIIVDDKKLISKIIDAGGSKLLLNSDKALFVLYSSLTDNLEYSDHIQSASAIIQNFLLLAHERGMGTCWVCHLPRKKDLKNLLNIPDDIEVIAAISIGYADYKNVKPPERKYGIKDIVGYNTFYSSAEARKNKKIIYAKLVLGRLYYMLPVFLKKYLNNFTDRYFVRKFER